VGFLSELTGVDVAYKISSSTYKCPRQLSYKENLIIKKLNTYGFTHWVIPALVILIVGGIGTYLLTVGHADTPTSILRVGTLNTLGSSHTCPRGSKCQHPGWPSYTVRAPHEVDAVNTSNVSLIGFQELSGVQATLFRQLLGSKWSTYSGGSNANMIAWRNDIFEPTAVARGSFTYPYYKGNVQAANWAVLKRRVTGKEAILVNFHPESLHYDGATQAAHDKDIANMANAWNAIFATKYPGVPIVLTGDMNGHYADFFCPFGKSVNQGALSADGSKVINDRCTSGSVPTSIDWIITSANGGARFSNYSRNLNLQNNKWTDHPYVTTSISLP
jgi:hypothetical protein